MSVTVVDLYNEIIKVNRSVGECEAAISHTQDTVVRSHNDLKESLSKIDSRLSQLESSENARERRSKFLWNLINISPGNIAKWISILLLTGSIVTTFIRMNIGQAVIKLLQFAMG